MSPERPHATSWKGIAAYLGVSVRTAQLWEKDRGLPVRRLPGPRGPVSAAFEELDAWLAGDRKNAPVATVPAPPAARIAPWPWIGSGFGAAVLVVAAVWAVVLRPGEPAEWTVEGNSLVVNDTRGREVFRRTFEERLDDYKHPTRQNREHAWIGDLDGDGEKEVVFGVSQSLATMDESDEVLCFSARGEMKWRFELGAAARSFEEKLRPPYRFRNLAVLPSGNRLVVAASHRNLYASQVALLSPQGELQREYWHSGHLGALAITSAGFPKPMILAGGVSNSYKAATIVVLDPDAFEGVSSEVIPRYQLPGKPGREFARILLPRSCVNLAKYDYNVVERIAIQGDRLEAWVLEDFVTRVEVAHAFGPGFAHRGVMRGSHYKVRESELVRLGEVTASDCADLGSVRRLPVSSNGVTLSAVSYQKSR